MRQTISARRLLPALLAVAATVAGCEGAAPQRADGAEPSTDVPTTAAARQAGLPDGASLDLGYTMGDPEAPIHVVEFSDFGCPYCGRFARSTLPQLRDEYVETGVVHWRYVPVVFGFAGGERMGAAGVCAAEQGGTDAFWKAHDVLYRRQTALRADDARPRLLDWMADLGLDRDALDRCIDADATHALLETHNRASGDWFVRGTPTFVINGVPLSGALPVQFFQKVFATVLDPYGL